ncbi:MAG: glycoside hydrolase family 9 protein [Candidatus Lokiarchaeota archaeon]|nr:glycoside hydrolase family 9 protein [Candidatus Lokiarchaeota archaeon]
MLKTKSKKIISILIITTFIFSILSGLPIPGQISSLNTSPWPPTEESQNNYAAALQKSIYFYLQQRTGDLPDDNPVIWRGDSCLDDGADVGLDLTGGYLDAGDHVKFGLPMASTVATLALGVLEYESGFQSAGQLDEVIDAIKWGTDYFIKCSPNANEFYFQVGDGNADHAWWGPVEVLENVMTRPSYKATTSQGGSAVVGASAAALVLTSIILEDSDPSYASQCLTYALRLYNLARQTLSDSYYDSIAGSFYKSWSGFYDEIACTAALLYMKTGDNSYLTQAEEAAQNWNLQGQESYWEYQWGHSWDDMHYIAQLLLARITGKQEYIDSVERNLDWWMPGGGITYSPGGLAWLDSWGALRYAANTAFLAFMWADSPQCTPSKVSTYQNFAESQINYALGDNPRGSSYIIGFGHNTPQNPHHRTAHGSWANSISTPTETRHILYGALVGGPDASDNYQDDRNDYVMNEVACDYNSGLVAALGKMTEMFGGSPHSDFPNTWFKPEDERMPEMYADARLNSEGNQYTEISIDLVNHAAWPARNGDKMSYRYYFDITECIAAGYSVNDIVIESGYSEVPTSITGPHHVEGNVYYILVDYTGSNIFPGGQSESARETQVRIRLPYDAPTSAWDTSNDWSHQGLSNTRAPSEYIPVFDDGVLVYGQPVGPVITPPSINSPVNVNYQEGETGNTITWVATDDNPTTYIITRNGQQVASNSWSSGSAIIINVDGLLDGTYTYICTVSDGDGQSDSDTVIVTVSTISTWQNGDVNHDGEVDIVDALLISQYYVGLDPQPFYPEEADVDDSGEINIIDALLVAQAYVGLIELPS